jgi:hypothetical protein
MITFKLGQLKVCEKQIAALDKCEFVDFKTKYHAGKIIRKLDSVLKVIEQERIALLNTHCKKDENGKPVLVENAFQFEEGKKEEFQLEFAKYLEVEENIDLKKLSIGGVLKASPEMNSAFGLAEIDFIFDTID